MKGLRVAALVLVTGLACCLPPDAGAEGPLEIVGWSTRPLEPRSVRILAPPPLPGGFDAKPRLSASTLGNGDTVTASVTLPSGAAPGSRALLLLASSNGSEPWFHVWTVFVEPR